MDTSLKISAEDILAMLGIKPSGTIPMENSRIIPQRGLPFEAKHPEAKPVAIGSMPCEESDAELRKWVHPSVTVPLCPPMRRMHREPGV